MKLNYISSKLVGRNVRSPKTDERKVNVKGKLAFNADGSLKL